MTDRTPSAASETGSPTLTTTMATLTEITTRLVGDPDTATVLRLINEIGTGPLAAAATGVMIKPSHGRLEVLDASDETALFVELLQSQVDQGPCAECVRTNEVLTIRDLTTQQERWPDFTPAALAAGYRSIIAIPMRLDSRAIGGFNLLYAEPTVLAEWQLQLAQIVSDLAVLALVQEAVDRRADRLVEATMTAFNDRIRFDQAVGMVAGALDITPGDAQVLVIKYTATHPRALHQITRAITDGTLDPTDLID